MHVPVCILYMCVDKKRKEEGNFLFKKLRVYEHREVILKNKCKLRGEMLENLPVSNMKRWNVRKNSTQKHTSLT